MLVAQAKRSAELFTGTEIADGRVAEIERAVRARLENIVIIGMPGCGKSSVARRLGERLGREVVECDAYIEQQAGKTIPEIFAEGGETAFRRLETEALRELGKRSGIILSTGGGCVTRSENYPLLHQNSQIVMLNRKLDELAHKGRPITARDGIDKLAEQRMPRYRAWADYIIDSRNCAANTARAVLDTL